jgi:drug/metabolite transporter (DMT)-like permease
MAPFFLKEKIYKTTWIAIMLSSLGLWFIFGGTTADNGTSLRHSEKLAIIAGTLSGLAYAFLILIVREIASHFPSLFITCIQSIIVTLVLLPFVLKMHVSFQAIPYLIILGVVHSTIAPLLYVQGCRSVKANEAAILGYFEPVGAIILALILLHEKPGLQALMGGALILYSGYIILRRRGA